uniref:F-box domain-containing protein n=1 Tax=Leersia perrieri TaxID=77586 RepID=A0A0D9VUH4_9ORYZ
MADAAAELPADGAVEEITAIVQLPDNVVKDIIFRLPPRNIITGCRAVCKSWRRLTSNPAFYNNFPRRTRDTRPIAAKITVKKITRAGAGGVAGGEPTTEDTIIPLPLEHRRRGLPTSYRRVLSLGAATDKDKLSSLVLGSWDGVLCIAMANAYLLWNPLTNACATVSPPADDGKGKLVGGYAHPATGRFHLLHASGTTTTNHGYGYKYHQLMSPAIFRVQTVGDASWRAGPAPPPRITMPLDASARAVALHGKLHWLVRHGNLLPADQNMKLLAFDTARERIRLKETPERMAALGVEKARITVLPGAGKLCVLAPDSYYSFKIMMWVLEDYGGDHRKSWQVKVTIDLYEMRRWWRPRRKKYWDLYRSYYNTQLEVVQGAEEEEGGEVFVHTGRRVDAYSVRRGRWRRPNNIARSVAGKVHVSMLRHDHGELPLPHEVSFGAASRDIISRLPSHNIITSCRAVCKSWRRLTSKPVFHNNFPRARPRPVAAKITIKRITRAGAGGGEATTTEDTIIRFELFRCHWNTGAAAVPTSYRRVISLGAATDKEKMSSLVLGSWDGVLCIAMANAYVLWNPLTNACATVSPPADDGKLIGCYAHPATGRFHLLHASGTTYVSYHNDYHLMSPAIFRVQTVGDAAWRAGPSPPPKITMPRRASARAGAVTLHGKLHWLVQHGNLLSADQNMKLLAFDTARERIRLKETPERMASLDVEKARITVLPGAGAGDGKLCVLAPDSYYSFKIMMTTAAIDHRKSWQVKARIDLDGIRRWWHPRRGVYWPELCCSTQVGVVQGGEVFVHGGGRVDAYSVRRGRWRRPNDVARSVAGKVHVSMLRHDHGELPLPHEVSFGAASRVLSRSRSLHAWGQCCYRI